MTALIPCTFPRSLRRPIGTIALAIALAGCSGSVGLEGATGDGAGPDAGPRVDTPVAPGDDTAARDATTADARTDSGPGPDAGAPPDASGDAAPPPDSGAPSDVSGDVAPPPDAGPDTVAEGCSACHGDETTPAPPLDLEGNELTTARGVGAHRSHLGASSWHRTVACAECHVVPSAGGDPGHWDDQLPAELTWGPLALADGAAPAWDGARCSNTYCHGGTRGAGGRNTAPQWTVVDGTEAACGACHGLPPDPPHPADDRCAQCHPTIDANRRFLAPDRHIDGVLDVAGATACDACHGSNGDAAPPRDLDGDEATTARGVGAHRAHLGGATWHAEVTCDACHQVPTAVADAGHSDSAPPAELTWGAQATRDGAAPSWDGQRCSSTYCHGGTLAAAGANTAPAWTVVDGTEAACGACHALPPPAPHVQSDACARCHPTVDAERRFIAPARHIDGTVDVAGDLTCDACHGSDGSAAPPRDLAGNTATTARGVGAHRSHLGAATWHAAVSCGDCHVVPAATDAPGHADSSPPAELRWSDRATNDGAVPDWDGQRCSNTYCHGATLDAGGALTAPEWTVVDGSQAACGSCHALPPTAPHPQSDACAACHPTIDGDGLIVAPQRHIDGRVDVEATVACDACHGADGNPAPPPSLAGETSTDARAVGAHAIHLAPSPWHATVACSECHTVPTTVTAAGHLDSATPAELRWGDLATQDGAAPGWDGQRCSNTYCHGATLTPGGAITAPSWTDVGGGQADCGTCHGLPPDAPHPDADDCATCHGDVIAADGTFLHPERHVDGVLQVAAVHPTGWIAPGAHGATFNAGGVGACAACHGATLDGGSSGVSCDDCHGGWETDCTFCHGGAEDGTGAPPEGVDGETARTALAVGAHGAHVRATGTHVAWGCALCHRRPDSALDDGHVDGDGRAEVALAAPDGGAAYDPTTGTCSSSYCHGNGRRAGSADWNTDPTLGCDSCHPSNELGGEHREHVREGISCHRCHASVVDADRTIIGLDRHVDGNRDVSFSSGGSWDPATRRCAGVCHGSEGW